MMTRLNSALVTCSAFAAALFCNASPALGQQFVDATASRFPGEAIPGGEYTNQMTVGDLDGDGDLDIIFANGGNFSTAGTPQQLRVYINNGSGNFTDQSVARLPVGSLFLARGVELGDIEGDGDLDIIVAQDFSRQPQLFVNNGAGFFANETLTRLPQMLLSSARGQFGDVDNDGDLDIYLVHGGASRFGTAMGRLWINNGAGFFADETAARMPNQTVIQPMDCIFGDVDGNFSLDLLIASRNTVAAATNAKLYKNNGAGIFSSVAMQSSKNNYSFDFGDMDGDGDLDIIGANAHPTSTNSELLLRNGGTGAYVSLAFPVNAIDDNDSKFFDYDNDGDLDLIVGSLGSTERVYNNNGQGVFTLINGVITAVADATMDIEVADFNGDGRLDVVTGQGESGSFINRIFINVSGPIDTIPPTIIKTEKIPDALSADGPRHIRAVIYDGMTSDRGFHNKGVVLNYSVEGQIGVNEVPMKWVGNSIWRGSIPAQPTGAVVNYYVTARDFANNLGTGPTHSYSVLWPPCPADTNVDHIVNVNDLLEIINNWGPVVPATHSVSVSDFVFTPSQLNAKSGDTIQFNWAGGFHTATSGADCVPDGKFNFNINGPGSFQYVIPNAFSGALPYYCTPHCAQGMVGNVTVAPVPADINHDGIVNVNDLLLVINSWGPCPLK